MFPPCSAQKQQAMLPLSADLWMLGLMAVVAAADLSTSQGRKDLFLIGHGVVLRS